MRACVAAGLDVDRLHGEHGGAAAALPAKACRIDLDWRQSAPRERGQSEQRRPHVPTGAPPPSSKSIKYMAFLRAPEARLGRSASSRTMMYFTYSEATHTNGEPATDLAARA